MNKVFISNCLTCKYNNYWVLEIVLNKDICLEHFLANFNVKTCDMTIQVSILYEDNTSVCNIWIILGLLK